MPRFYPQDVVSLSQELGVETAFWEMTESEEDLYSLAHTSATERQEITACHGRTRRLEKLSALALIKNMAGQESTIGHTPSGLPILYRQEKKENLSGKTVHTEISISHTASFLAITLAPYPIGIDIERLRPEALRLCPRFLHKDEQDMVLSSPNPLETATLFWSAKEAAFKYARHSGLAFDEDIRLQPFLTDPHLLAVEIKIKDKGSLHTLQADVHTLVLPDFVFTLCVPPKKR